MFFKHIEEKAYTTSRLILAQVRSSISCSDYSAEKRFLKCTEIPKVLHTLYLPVVNTILKYLHGYSHLKYCGPLSLMDSSFSKFHHAPHPVFMITHVSKIYTEGIRRNKYDFLAIGCSDYHVFNVREPCFSASIQIHVESSSSSQLWCSRED